MKTFSRFFLVIMLASIGLSAFAQFSVVVFAPRGEKFTLYINGSEQNNEPSYRVEADNPGGPTFKARVFFSDPSIKEINKTIFNKPGSTMYYKVTRNAKGAYILEATGSEWIDADVEKETAKEANPAPAPEKSAAAIEKGSAAPEKSSGKKGCEHPMTDQDFTASLIGVSTAPFDPIKLSNAKKMADGHCLTVLQVVWTMEVFDNESSRLSFAKYAWDHTYNQSDYDDVKEALHSQRSRDDLDRYLAGKK